MPKEVKHPIILSIEQHVAMLILSSAFVICSPESGPCWTCSHIIISKEEILDYQHECGHPKNYYRISVGATTDVFWDKRWLIFQR